MKIKTLKISSYIYLILPIIIFCIGWIKPIISIPLCLGLLFILFLIYKQSKSDIAEFISKKLVAILLIVILLICIIAGQGGLFYQSPDHHWRNAVFRDLINFDWPVYYPNLNASLDYYIGHWIVPASIGKCFLSISSSAAWHIGNIALLLWSTIGVTLAFLWLIKLLNPKNTKYVFITLGIFFFFSGLDIIGAFLNPYVFSVPHLEWWTSSYQFSSMMTQLFWVFNQCICAWLITAMFLNEKRVNNYFLLILLCLPYAPLPFAGLIILLGYKGIELLITSIKNKHFILFLKDAFSIQNILAIICILPVYYFYYNSNSSASTTGFLIIKSFLNVDGILHLLFFWFIEIGIYGLIIFHRYKKNGLFYISFLSLIFIPLFRIGYGSDFSMRASIPILFVCMYFVIDYINNELEFIDKQKVIINIKCLLLIITLVLGMFTPLVEYYRAFKTIKDNRKISMVADNIITISDKNPNNFQNFLTLNPKESSIFFRYLSKNK